VKGEQQKQLSKEFVREWLMANGFQGQAGQQVPEMTESWVNQISERYIELYENIIGEKFIRSDVSNVHSRVETNVRAWIEKN
ncbi:MAG: phosphoribosylaminoimidazolesuccinocarboxamide synthase, partial [Bacteroidetes bacterium]